MSKETKSWGLYLINAAVLTAGLSLAISNITVWRDDFFYHMICTALAFGGGWLSIRKKWLIFLLSGSLVLASWGFPELRMDLIGAGGICAVFGGLCYSMERSWQVILLPSFLAVFVPVYMSSGNPSLLSLYLAAGGVLLLLPELYAQVIKKQKQELAEEALLQMKMVAVPVIVVCISVAAIIIPQDTTSWSPRIFQNFMEDMSTWIEGPYSGYSGYSSNFSLQQSGYGSETGRLGGDISLDDRQVLSVTAEQPPVWLKGKVSDSYTGYSWEDSQNDGQFRYGSLWWKKQQEAVFSSNQPIGGKSEQEIYDQLTETITYELTYRSQKYTTIFTGGNLRSLEWIKYQEKESLYFDQQSELYMKSKVPSGNKILLEVQRFKREDDQFDDRMLELETAAAEYEDQQYQEIEEKYTNLLDDLPEQVMDYAETAAGTGNSAYEKARNIEQWLSENYTYSLTPGDVPEDQDFVAWFLETGEGYCTYFASAMVVLARCEGIPARYVSGFSLGGTVGESRDSYAVRNENAHAWAELYIYGVGWVDFDPLKWENGGAYSSNHMTEDKEEDTEIPQGEEKADVEEQSTEMSDSEKQKNGLGRLIAVVTAAVIIFVILKFTPAFVLFFCKQSYKKERLERKYKSRTDQAERYYREIMNLLGMISFRAEPGDTLATLRKRAERELDFMEVPGILFSMREKAVYGSYQISESDIKTLEKYRNDLEHYIILIKGSWQYISKRVMR